MNSPRKFSGTSRRAGSLLKSGENRFVDYKLNIKGLHPEDICAFANSHDGGAILLGIKEEKTSRGQQIGRPVGHDIGDKTILEILSKANSCVPPVHVDIFTENIKENPFIRIEIPVSSLKPHSTSNGTYKIRHDGGNASLHPEQLLSLFLERETQEFRNRFNESTQHLEKDIAKVVNSTESLEEIISAKIEEIGFSLGWAEQKASESVDTIEAVRHVIDLVHTRSKENSKRMIRILGHLKEYDPIIEKIGLDIYEDIKKKIAKRPKEWDEIKKSGRLSATISGSLSEDYTKEELSLFLSKVLSKVILDLDRSKRQKIKNND